MSCAWIYLDTCMCNTAGLRGVVKIGISLAISTLFVFRRMPRADHRDIRECFDSMYFCRLSLLLFIMLLLEALCIHQVAGEGCARVGSAAYLIVALPARVRGSRELRVTDFTNPFSIATACSTIMYVPSKSRHAAITPIQTQEIICRVMDVHHSIGA